MSNFLVGKTINEIKIAEDKKALLFITTEGEFVVKVDGDCCSDSWVESVERPALGFPVKVLKAFDLEMPEEEDQENDDGEVITFYGFKMETTKGDIVIDYRNSSNGYYGGNLSWPDDDYFYGGVGGQNVSNEEWIDIEFE